ncbi:hypothetical protein [Streptomyces clavifer]
MKRGPTDTEDLLHRHAPQALGAAHAPEAHHPRARAAGLLP